MKKYSRTHCPDQIDFQGRVYKLDVTASHEYRKGKKYPGKDHVLVMVLSRNLRGKLDLHHRPYLPHPFIYSTEEAIKKAKEAAAVTPAVYSEHFQNDKPNQSV